MPTSVGSVEDHGVGGPHDLVRSSELFVVLLLPGASSQRTEESHELVDSGVLAVDDDDLML